ncbi:probable E3 ubiquitin-protein ligase DTX3 [Asterias rubens]|uniref:probable E3 ubiquitin-protein ligase DTX3 n=1 Tax=Asterias rubens TaxID=7604 RepID=UPI0014554C10|nr:probable E3 ubiquitin-protein ligase DTX3 [Asterias rubens]
MHPRERPFWKAKTTSCTWIKICVENIDVRGINSSYTTSRAGSNMDKSESSCDNQCPICLSDIADSVVLDKCKHRFCNVCITEVLKRSYRCPVCQTVCRQPKGNQPEGTMTMQHETFYHLPGYGNDGVITIRYIMPSGIQSEDHPNPGKPFTGVTRTAYLPDNQDGLQVLSLLKKAFDARLVFTVGRSITSGFDNIVTWNDIHHKTSQTGGPTRYGYPDPDYLRRVTEDLAAKGIFH